MKKLSRATQLASQVKILNPSLEGQEKLEVLVALLGESQIPLRKEFLIEKIWGSYEPSFESRFYRLVPRARTHGIKIINRQRAYQLAV